MKAHKCIKQIARLVFCILLASTFFFFADHTYAKKTLDDATGALSTVSGKTGIGEGNITDVVAKVIKTALAITGIAFFVLTVYAGFLWMTAQGKDEQVDSARKTLIAAAIGLIIIVSAYAITNFVQNNIIERKGSNEPSTSPDVAGSDMPLGCCYDWQAMNDAMRAVGGLKANRGIITEAQCKEIGTENIGDLINNKWEFHEGWDAQQCDEGL